MISGIGSNRDVAEFSEALREETGHLLLCAAVGMRNNDCRVGLLGIVVGRRINVGSDLDAVQAVGHRMDIDFTRRVCFNGSLVHQTIRIELGNIVGAAETLAMQAAAHTAAAIFFKVVMRKCPKMKVLKRITLHRAGLEQRQALFGQVRLPCCPHRAEGSR